MTLAMALTSIFGKAAANKLTTWLIGRPNGTQKMEAASEAMQKGATAIEALKSVFGIDFLKAVDSITGKGRSSFSYQAGIADYIKADTDPPAPPFKVLRDELNINLDRLNLMETADSRALKNHARGLFHIWEGRYMELAPGLHSGHVKTTFEVIGKLLNEQNPIKDLLKLAGVTGLGGGGVLLLVQGVFVVTGTGVGILALISLFLFGIPWPLVGALVLGGALLLVVAKALATHDDAISTCIQLAYQLIERGMAAQALHQPTTERE